MMRIVCLGLSPCPEGFREAGRRFVLKRSSRKLSLCLCVCVICKLYVCNYVYSPRHSYENKIWPFLRSALVAWSAACKGVHAILQIMCGHCLQSSVLCRMESRKCRHFGVLVDMTSLLPGHM